MVEPRPKSNRSFSGPASTRVEALKLLRRGVGVPVPSSVTFSGSAAAAVVKASNAVLTSAAIHRAFIESSPDRYLLFITILHINHRFPDQPRSRLLSGDDILRTLLLETCDALREEKRISRRAKSC